MKNWEILNFLKVIKPKKGSQRLQCVNLLRCQSVQYNTHGSKMLRKYRVYLKIEFCAITRDEVARSKDIKCTFKIIMNRKHNFKEYNYIFLPILICIIM